MSPAGGLQKESQQELTPKQWIERSQAVHGMAMQRFLAKFICFTLAGACAASFTLFFLQGFHIWGFNLDNSLMEWIGGATIGSIGGLAAAVYGAFFKKR